MTEGEEYLMMYPKLRKWINQCNACQDIGYKPELPLGLSTYDGDISAAADNLRAFFICLQINEVGLCDVCKKFIK
ncbi:hypothetical protein M4D55_25300 [Metabacillus idriensis]|uniref:hypothetical protein n=1 Tax=Metabacillus idriensis TaxID=324768 RepID=UPI00203B6FF9|nr:hypothetical protein [Metabacillus idriensis]MCM3599056.1 hypothetical protein [Metabacillus idriensis]